MLLPLQKEFTNMIVGDFSVQIINADTELPFKKHVRDDGKVFAEVEPDADFWVELQVIGGPEEREAYFQIFIDGNKLEQYFWSKKSYGKHWEGLTSFQNEEWTQKSFRFHVPEFRHDKSSSVSASTAMMGNVTVQNSEAIHVMTTDADFQGGMSQQVTKVTVNDGGGLESKTLRTVAGKSRGATPLDTWDVKVNGGLLEEITINYCTTLGLIHANILPKPPAWDYHRLRFGLSDDEKEEMSDSEFSCKKIVTQATYGPDGKELVKEKFFELFDLTGDNSDLEDDMEADERAKASVKKTTKPKRNGGKGGLYRGGSLEK
jgi:hypothetical protein